MQPFTGPEMYRYKYTEMGVAQYSTCLVCMKAWVQSTVPQKKKRKEEEE
jgi:hypothetical protein